MFKNVHSLLNIFTLKMFLLLHLLLIVSDFIYKFIKTIVTKNLQCNQIKILYKSKNFLVINKPYDMVINSNSPSVKGSVQVEVRNMFPNLVNSNLHHEFYFVHRLDYVTSGAMCIALNKFAARAASKAFQKRTVEKYYIALVHGHVAKPSMVINILIGNDIRELNGNRKMCTIDNSFCQNPRKSCTALLVLEKGYRNKKAATKILLYPVTGRRHQLRVHCTYIGHIIIGDYTYSGKTDIEPHRTFLHALRLIIDNAAEYLDTRTFDPFTSSNSKNQWNPTKVLRILDESAFSDIKNLISDI